MVSLEPGPQVAFRSDVELASPGNTGRQKLELVTECRQTLRASRTALPGSSPMMRQGQELFDTPPAANCHVPHLTTGRSAKAVERVIYGQAIWTCTDPLAHDPAQRLRESVGFSRTAGPAASWRRPIGRGGRWGQPQRANRLS